MNFYHEIVSKLPGDRGTYCLHQGNGITFAPDGSFFSASGSPGGRQH